MTVGFDGIALSLLPALFFALGVQCLNRGLAFADSRTGTLIDIVTTTTIYWLLAPFFLETGHWATPATAIFILVGLFRPVLSANLALAGVQRLGPTLSSAFTSTGPLFAAVFAIVMLGEQLTWLIAVGTVAVVIGSLVEVRPGTTTRGWPLWALIFPFSATALRAFAHVLIAAGLAIMPEPLFAGLLAYTTSSLIGLAVESRSRDRRYLQRSWGLAWFAVGGLMHACAVWSMNAALMVAPVTVVVPLSASTPVFSMLLGVYIFRRETIGLRRCIAVLMIVAGVIVIAL